MFLSVLTTGSLRGVKESARLFGVPVYAFLGVMLALIATGAYHLLTGGDVQSLGKRVTAAVVHAIFSIILLDAAFALLYMQLDI